MWGFGAKLQCKETNGMICPNWLHWSGKLPAWATLAPQPLSTTPLLPCIPIPATHPPTRPLHMQRAVHPSELPTAWWNKNVAKNPLMTPHTPTSISTSMKNLHTMFPALLFWLCEPWTPLDCKFKVVAGVKALFGLKANLKQDHAEHAVRNEGLKMSPTVI
jgi:hypothetical protein